MEILLHPSDAAAGGALAFRLASARLAGHAGPAGGPMLRLTLRSSRDGHFLARVVDRGGFPFVLDFGDRRIIEDAGQRLLHGFTMWRHGRLVSAPPGDSDLLALLADFYAGEGLLVFLEEPNWHARVEATWETDPQPPGPLTSLHDLGEQDDRTELADEETLGELDDQTEIARIDFTRLEPYYDQAETTVHTDLDILRLPDIEEDDETELAKRDG